MHIHIYNTLALDGREIPLLTGRMEDFDGDASDFVSQGGIVWASRMAARLI